MAVTLTAFFAAAFTHNEQIPNRPFGRTVAVAFHVLQKPPEAPCVAAIVSAANPACMAAIEAQGQQVTAWNLQNQQSSALSPGASSQQSYSSSVSYEALYIYSCESGSCGDIGTYSLTVWNSEGCYGIGQDCSGVVAATCGPDFACQHAFFTNYAITRYGSWGGAYAFWTANRWW